MLSILIPTYNYDVTELVNTLHEQCLQAKLTFEILVLDDVIYKTQHTLIKIDVA